MWLKYQIILFFFSISIFCGAQQGQLSASAQISVLTCGAGDDLYTTFGHSAFRVQDPVQGLDVVYNYGTFDFNPPMFYVDFAKGNLYYSLSKQETPYFLYAYELENRWVKEQHLNLDQKEINSLYQFLETNHLPENRDYKYDFFYNNCATKIGDVLEESLGTKLHFKDQLEEKYTFRELLHQKLTLNSWSSFGIDLALGSVIDKTASSKEHMFLPDYVMKQLGNTSLDLQNLVSKEQMILNRKESNTGSNFLTTPLFWILAFSVFVISITYLDFKNKKRSRILDFGLFILTGLAGILLLFLWFFTDHTATVDNFNILWVFPLNTFIAFIVLKKNGEASWLPKYMLLLLGLLVLTTIFWILNIQSFSPLIVPLLILLGIRYLFLWNYFQQSIRLK
ncbi:lipoprotein N-acyltransferase Lnb domain-containing protein [Arenibacter certesii]|uniref:DUF4105 domain-containing protein n=1 Tax=Arenibacter certesii TaxID=228955 RepID=A0A918MK00_9FLAO|nr:DUF4105 domain-containing protein [Arenibacter certesii]GGW33572.1 hypothetical protein GCM10007383_18320 [Arenibacter certesii]